MEGFKTVLLYLFGLAVLILASIIFTGQGERWASELPPAIPTATSPTTLTKSNQSDCIPSAMSITYRYIPNSPFTTTLIPADLKEDRLIISGIVYASDRFTPLPGAVVEVWQADAEGRYDRLRAQMQTDIEGRYEFTTVKPGHYQVDCRFLPAHIHYRVTYLDSQPVLTSLYFEDDPYLADVPRIEPAFIRPLITQAGPDGPILHTTYDLVLPVKSESSQ